MTSILRLAIKLRHDNESDYLHTSIDKILNGNITKEMPTVYGVREYPDILNGCTLSWFLSRNIEKQERELGYW